MLPSSFWLVPSDVSLDSKDRICRAFVSLAWLPFASLFYAGRILLPWPYMLETLFKDKLDSGANAEQRLDVCFQTPV